MNCADQSESKYDTEIEPTRLCIKQIKITEFKVLNSKNHSDSIRFSFFLSAEKKYKSNWETGYNITKSLLYKTKFSGYKCLGQREQLSLPRLI